jgi:hypothetical protein
VHLSRASIINKIEEVNQENQEKIKNEVNNTTKTSIGFLYFNILINFLKLSKGFFEKNNDLHKNHPFNTGNLQHSRVNFILD